MKMKYAGMLLTSLGICRGGGFRSRPAMHSDVRKPTREQRCQRQPAENPFFTDVTSNQA